MPSTMKDAIEKANVTTKAAQTSEELAMAAPAATIKDALANVLLEVPKSARKSVEEGTQFLMKSAITKAHNSFECGATLADIQDKVGEKSFARLINEVWSRFGLTRVTIYRWIRNSAVLAVAVPYDVARDAIIAVSGGDGLVAPGKDGNPPSLSGGYTAGIKKHVVPRAGTSYEDCLDWAREVQVIAERNAETIRQTMADVFKAAHGRFAVMLNGNKSLTANLKFATEFAVICYRDLYAKSEPCALAAFAAFEDSSIAPATAGENAMIELRAAHEADVAAKAATKAARKTTARQPVVA